jgi:pimeloyl-ACP methyl ester carboxylesterase
MKGFTTMTSSTILFIHGMFMTARCWEQWVTHFERQGYRCVAPNWPGRDKTAATLRQQHPDPAVGNLTLRQVIDHHLQLIREMGERPVVIGHSMGGLIAQVLLQQDLIAGAVAIDSGPPLGVFVPSWRFLKSNLPVINPLVSATTPYLMPFEGFQDTFVNDLPLAEQRAAYEAHLVPESRQVGRAALTSIAKVDFTKARPPLLFIAGGNDHVIPPALNRANHAKYKQSPAVTDYKEFPGRTHFLIGQTGWQEIADYCLGWLRQRVTTTA